MYELFIVCTLGLLTIRIFVRISRFLNVSTMIKLLQEHALSVED